MLLKEFKKKGYIISPYNRTIINTIIDKQDIVSLNNEIRQIVCDLKNKHSTTTTTIYKLNCSESDECLFDAFNYDKVLLDTFYNSIKDVKTKIINDFNYQIKFELKSHSNYDFTNTLFTDWLPINNVILQYNRYLSFKLLHYDKILKMFKKEEKNKIENILAIYKEIFSETIFKHNLIQMDDDGFLYTKNFRKCPNCNNITGNIGACSARKCGFDNDINVDQYIKTNKNIKIFNNKKYYEFGCGSVYNWDKGEYVYLYEFGDDLPLSELYKISLFK